MPWTTPTLRTVRETIRGEVTASLGRASFIGNSVLRVMADAMAAMTHLTLRYVDWLSLQLLPDTAETEWLDRHGQIWLTNADGTIGRKAATFATGKVTFTGTEGTVVPLATQLVAADEQNFETTEEIVLGVSPTEAPVRALDAGAAGNLETGTTLNLLTDIPDVDSNVLVVELRGGVDIESDDDLRYRVLLRIRQPPMGGAAHDYVNWALAVPGVTRAWCYPLEMGIGTVTVRFMMDELRATTGGFPLQQDVADVAAYLDIMRPVAVKDIFVVAPIPYPVHVTIENMVRDDTSTQAAVEKSLEQMLLQQAIPGQTIFVAWKSSAIMSTPNVTSFRLVNTDDDVMPAPGYMAVLGNLLFL